MMYEVELTDRCGKLVVTDCRDVGGGDDNDNSTSLQNLAIEETIHNTRYKLDTRECVIMFKRFIDVYGREFQPLLGDKQYISDPFWDRVLPKEDEIRFIRHKRRRIKELQLADEKQMI